MNAELREVLRAIDAEAEIEAPPTTPIVLRIAGDLLRTGLQIDVVATWEPHRLTVRIESVTEWMEASAEMDGAKWVLDGQGTVPYTATQLQQPQG